MYGDDSKRFRERTFYVKMPYTFQPQSESTRACYAHLIRDFMLKIYI